MMFRFFPDAVEDNDGVHDGITDDGQDRRDKRIVDRQMENSVKCDQNQNIVEHRDDRSETEFPFKPYRDVNQHADTC